MILIDRIRIGNLEYECPVQRDEKGQTRSTFRDGKERAQIEGNTLPTIRQYISLFLTHAESPDSDLARLVGDIQEQPLEWANNALLREGREVFEITNPVIGENDRIKTPQILYYTPRFALPSDKTVFTIAELGELAKYWLGRSVKDIPANLRETVVTVPREGTISLVRIGKTKTGYCITSTMPGVQGVARGVTYDSSR